MSPKHAPISLILTVCVLSFMVMLPGCGNDKKKEAAKAQGPTPMKVIKAETRTMPYWGEFVGQINAVETVDIRARVAGFLQKKNFEEGRQVKKGALLFLIDPKPFQEDLKQAQSAMQYNEALLAKAKKDFLRFKKLYEENVVSRDEFESYQTQMATYQAQVNENKAQVENARIQLGYTKIYSPVDGTVGSVAVDVGNLVGQGENTLLATVSTDDPVYVNFSISESDYLRARRSPIMGNAEKREVKMVLADGKEYEHEGAFNMVDRAVDSRTGTLGIRVSFPNPDGILRPGQYAKVRVLIDNVENAVVVPVRGLIDTQGMKSLYVVGDDGKVVNKPVTTGFKVGELIVIREGLKTGDLVIVDGVRRVKPGMEIKPIVVPIEPAKGKDVTPAQGGANPEAAKPDGVDKPTDNATQEQAG